MDQESVELVAEYADIIQQGLTASFALEGKKLTISQADVQLADLTASGRGTLTESGVDVTFRRWYPAPALCPCLREKPLPP